MFRPMLFACVVVGALNPIAAQATDSPNLLFIMTDDQARWATGCYGNSDIHTPNMDRIAKEGALFTNAIVASPVCSPSRATLLSGLYPTEAGITDWISPAQSDAGAGLDAPTWTQVLQQNGYKTALFGKWHLGSEPDHHPTAKGYDHFMGFLVGGNKPVNPTLEVDGENEKLDGPLPDILVDHTMAWIDDNRDKPFAVSLHFRAPHLPYGPVPPEDTAHYANTDPTLPDFPGRDTEKLRKSTLGYYASISSIDRNIGRLLAYLDETGLTKNTVVIFTSDHGYNEGRHSINTKGNGQWIAGGVNGPKRPNMWETSITIPMLIRWPGKIKPGSQVDYPFSNLDYYRTVLGLLDIEVPSDSSARGMDISPALFGKSLPKRESLFGQYDLHNNGLAYLRMIRTDRYKYIHHFHENMTHELYDLERDPDEKRNLFRAGKHTNIVEALYNDMIDWMRSINDPLLTDTY